MLRPGKTVNITRFSNQKSLRNAGNNIQQQEEWKHLPHFSYEGKKAREETIHFNLRLELVQTQFWNPTKIFIQLRRVYHRWLIE